MIPKEDGKKAVRFQDLSLIQEQEEDGRLELSAAVPDLDVPDTLGEEPKPAACPFGERIARERAEKEKQKVAQEKERCKIPDLPKFPQHIIQIQAEEKERAKHRPTAGVNPQAGKERGRSFVTYSNYLCATTDHTINLQPGTSYHKSIEVTGSTSSGPSIQGSPRGTEFCLDPKCTRSTPLPDHLIPSLIGEGDYQPEQALTKTVNPYLAPSLQFYGSAAYHLKPTPQETLCKPDVITASSTNQYLHSQRDNTPPDYTVPPSSCVTTHLTQQPSTQSSEAPMNFLRENFPTPLPITKETLFHLDGPTLTTSQTAQRGSSPQLTNTAQSVQQTSQQVSTAARSQAFPPTMFSSSSGLPPNSQPMVSQGNYNQMSTVIGYDRSPAPPEVSRTNMTSYTTNYTSTPGQIYSTVSNLSRVQEKEELQKLNDRFSAYVNRVRQLSQQAHNVDTSAFLRSTKILEEEIVNLKAVYEAELEKLRKELEASSHEKHTLATQNNKQTVYVGELQDRLNIETDKTGKLLEEINLYQRKITGLEAQLQDATIAMQRPSDEVEQLRRTIENLTREVEQWKHRYDHEQIARQEAEGKVHQILQKVDLADQIHNQQIADYQSRLEMASASILSLEAKVRDLSTADVSVAEMLKQVRESAETELKKFQIESEEQYARNLAALKAQIDNDADALQRYQTEKSQLTGSIGELHAKIRNLEGQVANLQHQKQTLEDAVAVERNRSADNIQVLERKLREVQDLLIVKMREVTNAREANIPLKAEIEALKILLEEEEKRLRIPLGLVSASIVQATVPPSLTTSQIVNSSQSHSQILTTGSATNQVLSQASKQALIGSDIQHQYAAPSISGGTTVQTASVTPAVMSQPTVTSSVLPVHGSTTVTTAATTAETGAVTTTQAQGTVNLEANYDYSSTLARDSGLTNPLYPYIPSPPLDPMYIPDALQTTEEGTLAYDAEYGAGFSGNDLYMYGFSLPMTGPRYHYDTTPSINRLQADPSPRAIGPIRAKSAPANPELRTGTGEVTEEQISAADAAVEAAKQRNLNLIPSNLGSGRDYFDDMFNDLQRATLYSKPRPKSSPLHNRLPSSFHDYTVSTSSAIGDLKVLEVNQEGKFVRLVNDGPTEFEFGGYMIQQNVGGHPVAVYRFPPRTKFPPDSTITVWSAMNDPKLHNPPTDFFWKEQQKWGTGPECTTILCRANGQAVAWTTAAHRFTKDAFMEVTKTDDEKVEEARDDESLTELNLDSNGPKPTNVYLRREKQQPRSLVAGKHPHGSSPSTPVHPHVTQPRPLKQGNDNSSYNRQSRTQTTRPDPIPGQPYAGAPAQRMGSAPLKKLACCNTGTQATTIRGNGNLANKPAGSIRMAQASPLLSVRQEQLIDETRERAQNLIRFTP